MSQEYTEDKEVTLTRLSSGRRLLEALLIIVALSAVWLMAALLSFNPSDPSWSQTAWHEPIHNIGGVPGAWLADTLFFVFGVMAYFIPVIVIGGCWFAWRYRRENDHIDYFAVALRLIGVLALVITSCGLAAMNADDIWYFASGGVIGSLLSTALSPMLNNSGGTLAMLCVWAAGLTLFTGWSWVAIAEKLGSAVLRVLTFASNRTRPHRDDSWVDDDDAYDEYEDVLSGDDAITPVVQESRRARILRSALARRHRLADKFANPLGRRSDAALFSGKRMDDEGAPVTEYQRQGVPLDPDDVLFSGHNATHAAQPEYDPLFDAPAATSPPWTQPPSAPVTAAAHDAGWQAAPPAASVVYPPEAYATARLAPDDFPAQPTCADDHRVYETQQPLQPAALYAPGTHPGVNTYGQPFAESLAADAACEASQNAIQPAAQVDFDCQQTLAVDPVYQAYQTVTPQSADAGRQPPSQADFERQPTQMPQPVFDSWQPAGAPYNEVPVYADGNAASEGSAPPAVSDSYPAAEPVYPVASPASAVAMEPPTGVEPTRSGRPPLYYFEEVEERRAREREQLEAWYQPIPEPVVENYSRPMSPRAQPETTASPDIATALTQATAQNAPIPDSAAALFTPAGQAGNVAPRPQVKEGIGPQLPRPNRVRVPTRRELASYGIKLPSQREAERRLQTEEPLEDDEQLALAEQAELARQFAASQHSRYGAGYQEQDSRDEDGAQQAELARQFAASQHNRYREPEHATPPPLASYAAQPRQMPEPLAPSGYPQPAVAQQPPSQAWHQPEVQHSVPGQPLPTHPPAARMPAGHPAHAVSGYGAPGQPSPEASGASPYPPLAASVPPAAATNTPAAHDTLLHPLLMRNGDSRPLQKPTTPLPSLDLLTSPPSEVEPVDTFALEQMARLVEARLADFRIKADVVNYSPGPVITRFELNLAPGVKAARISNLSRDLARSLSTVAVRVVEVIPGKPYVGLELPNKKRHTVYLREVLDCQRFRETGSPLTVVLGKDIAGDPVVADLQKMPHLLVAGTTGSGKSVGVNAMILSMLYKATPEEVKFIMIDPKMLELSVYEGIPHLLTEVVTDMKDAANALRWCVNEMERRYKLMSALGVRNLAGYNAKILEAEQMGRPIPDPYWKPGDSMDAAHPMLEKAPYIVVIVDEFADLMMTVGKKVEELIARLAQKARAAGIHLVLATQRPSVDVITGLIKANIPTRIAFTVSSKIDSRTILDQSGAESLLGMGDMLYMAPNSSTPIRVHGAFVRDEEVHSVVQDWKARGRPQYISGITADNQGEGGTGGATDGGEELDALFDQAVQFVVEKRKASISGVQRQFRIGYNRAARIIEQMEAQGIVSEPGHNGNREVLAPPPFE